MTLEEITQAASRIIDSKGPFMELKGARRVRANLIILKSRKQVNYTPETEQWSVISTPVPPPKHSAITEEKPSILGLDAPMNISSMTVSELYTFLKGNSTK